MRIVIIVRPLGGGTTVALCVAKALASLRGGIRPAKVRFITMNDTCGPVLAPWRIDPQRVASLASLEESVRAAAGAISVIDTMSDVRVLAREGYLFAVNEERERLNQRPIEGIMPAGWQAINARVEGATWRAALDVKADLIEVWRQGQGYARDPDVGLTETFGVRTKGQVEGPAGVGLVLQIVEGGLRSSGDIGTRMLQIVADPSGQDNGSDISLPEITSGKRRLEVLARVRALVAPALKRNMELCDREVAAWAAVPQVADQWPEAAVFVQGEEVKRVLEEIHGLFFEAGLDSQKKEAVAARKRMLRDIWNVTRTESLSSFTLQDLLEGMPRLRIAVREFKVSMKKVEAFIRAPQGSSGAVQTGMAGLQSLFANFGVGEAAQLRLLKVHAKVDSIEAFGRLSADEMNTALETMGQELSSGSLYSAP